MPAAFSQVLVTYAFTGNSLAPSSGASNLTAYNFAASPGLLSPVFYSGNTTTNTTSGANAYQNSGTNTGSGGWGTAFDEDNYYTFTVEPGAEYELNLTTLTFFTSKNANGANSWEVRSSEDDFASISGSGTGIFQGTPGDAAWTNPTVTLDLSGITGPVEFRIYGYAGTSGNWRIDDVTLNGTISAIPEPASAALVLVGVAAAGLFRRSRGNS